MATFNKFNAFVENLAEKVHNLGSDQLVVALTNTLPTSANSVLTDITQITYTNLSSRNITTTSSAQTGGLYKLVLTDLVLTATGAVGPFRYVVIYNDTPTSPADPLIGWYDYGSSISLASGETLTIDFDAANGLLNLQ
jgi:hypothetical protein